jgi:predicted ATP-dependent endonuclease of OLD family
MIREFGVKNYKSILDNTVELGRFNVFIGENGCGKTNLLEAMAMAAAAVSDKLDAEELYARGIRIAKPAITFSSFLNAKQNHEIELCCSFDPNAEGASQRAEFRIGSQEPDSIDAKWSDKEGGKVTFPDFDGSARSVRTVLRFFSEIVKSNPKGSTFDKSKIDFSHLAQLLPPDVLQKFINEFFVGLTRTELRQLLGDFVLYDISSLALRGIQSSSRKNPLGINGESLDVLIASFDSTTMKELMRCSKFVTWVDKVLLDPGDDLKLKGYKLGRSTSTLYFKDKFMRRNNNIFSAENANEGILHVLFYLALFISEKTPSIFGIDNIDTALNPQLCRDLTKELAALAKKHDKQALVTTHNPAILDGLNLNDDDQRLFVVSRNDEGHTVTERIRVKPSMGNEKYKLSELWMRGALGGLPTGF